MKQNRGKIRYSIQAVLKVVSASAGFWVWRALLCEEVMRLERLVDEAAAFFGRKDDLGIDL